jgi:hypothetical protein
MVYSLFRYVRQRVLSHLFYKRQLLCFLFIPVLIGYSCSKDNPEPTSNNKITLSSQTFGTQPYYSMGYSFENQEFIKRINSGAEIDIYLNEIVNPKGELIGVQFATNTISETTFGFYLNATLEDSIEAKNYYNNYIVADFPEYVELTDSIKEFQVYTFRTWKLNYVKFYVSAIRVVYSGERADYIEVDLEYYIQRDGSDNIAN